MWFELTKKKAGPVTFKVDKGYNGGRPTLLSTTFSWTKVHTKKKNLLCTSL